MIDVCANNLTITYNQNTVFHQRRLAWVEGALVA